jgi:hypothetical protein
MPTDRIPLKLLDYHPKGIRERGGPLMRWRDRFECPWNRKRAKGSTLVVDDIEEVFSSTHLLLLFIKNF